MSSSNANFDVEKLFKTTGDLDETIKTGVRRVLKAFYHGTEMSQSRIQENVATGLDHVCITYDQVEEDKKKASGLGLGAVEREVGFRFQSQDNNKAKKQIEKDKTIYDEGSVERVVIEGISYAVTNSQNPIGPFDSVLSTILETLKDVAQYYQSADNSENLSAPSEDD